MAENRTAGFWSSETEVLMSTRVPCPSLSALLTIVRVTAALPAGTAVQSLHVLLMAPADFDLVSPRSLGLCRTEGGGGEQVSRWRCVGHSR